MIVHQGRVRRRPRGAGPRLLVLVLAGGVLSLDGPAPMPLARADPGAASVPEPGRFVLPPPSAARGRADGGASGWWIGTTGIVLALALFGAGSLAARRLLPRGDEGPPALRVVGRASLSPRHSVALLRAGDRILIIGTGPQGPPSLLGEWTEPAPEAAPRLDVRIGDDR